MMIRSQVNLYVADVEAAVAFYRDLLGFTETFRTLSRAPQPMPSSASTGSPWASPQSTPCGASTA